MAAEDELDRAIARAAPRAPEGFAVAVAARLAQKEARGRRLAIAGAIVTLAAAAMVLLLLKPSPRPVDGWRATAAQAATVVGVDGKRVPLVPGGVVAPGERVEVAGGGRARLERGHAAVTLRPASAARLLEPVPDLQIQYGSALLDGPDARVKVDDTIVTALGSDAAVVVDARRNDMNVKQLIGPGKQVLVAAATAAVVAVSVQHGAAKVQPATGDPLQLGAHDRALVAPEDTVVARGQAGLSFATTYDMAQALDPAFERCASDGNDLPAGTKRYAILLTVVDLDGRAMVEHVELSPGPAPRTTACIRRAIAETSFPAPAGPQPSQLQIMVARPEAKNDGDDVQLLQPHF